MSQKPIVYLDDSLPITYEFPIKNGKVWYEKMNELAELLNYAELMSDEKNRDILLAEYHDAREDVVFEDRPYAQEQRFLLGAAYAGVNIPKQYAMNPATWESLPQSEKDKFELRETEEPK
jgi:hypothetical protein